MARLKSGTDHVFLSVIGLVAFFGIWTLIAVSGLVQPQFLPTPWAVAQQFIELTQRPFVGYTLQTHLASSLGRFAMGFALAVAIGATKRSASNSGLTIASSARNQPIAKPSGTPINAASANPMAKRPMLEARCVCSV